MPIGAKIAFLPPSGLFFIGKLTWQAVLEISYAIVLLERVRGNLTVLPINPFHFLRNPEVRIIADFKL